MSDEISSPVAMQPVTSSNVTHVGHCPERNCIDVTFKGGSTYRYPDCDRKLFDDMIASDSIGKFVHANLKSKNHTKL